MACRIDIRKGSLLSESVRDLGYEKILAVKEEISALEENTIYHDLWCLHPHV